MKKKIERNRFKEKSLIIYPKEYGAHILLTIIVLGISLPSLYFIGKEFSISEIDKGSIYSGIILIGIIIVICGYFLTSTIFLITKMIKLEVTEEFIKFKGVLGEKMMYIEDIKSIYKVNNYRTIISFLQIRRSKVSLKKSSRIIYFPNLWFSESDLLNVIEFIRKYNKDVLIEGIYAREISLSNKPYRKNKRK